MKKLILVSAIAMSGLIYQTANAQIGVHFNINLGARPVVVEQAPVYNDADFYYLPEVEAYYSVNQHCYYYQDGGNWISAAYLPGRFHDYDWQHANHYAVREARPYLHNDVYRARYGGLEGRRDWNYRDERSTRVYADRERFNNQYHNQNYGRDNQRNEQRFDNNRNDHQQQNDNHTRFDNRNDHQQSQPQNNNHSDRGNDNRGNNDNGQGRGGRF
jgi:hypothetical protein